MRSRLTNASTVMRDDSTWLTLITCPASTAFCRIMELANFSMSHEVTPWLRSLPFARSSSRNVSMCASVTNIESFSTRHARSIAMTKHDRLVEGPSIDAVKGIGNWRRYSLYDKCDCSSRQRSIHASDGSTLVPQSSGSHCHDATNRFWSSYH
jgi:hypothetical protein